VNTTSGALTAISGSPFSTAGTHPNAIAAHTSGKFLYVANSGTDDVSAFTIDTSTGSLTAIGSPTLAGGSSATAGSPVGLAVHPNGKFLYAAMDATGIAVFSINTTTGALTFVNTVVPIGGGQPQSVIAESTGKFLYAADGVTNVEAFSIDSTTGNLTPLTSNSTVAAGTVPIVLVADSTASHVYVASQGSNNAFSFGILTTGVLSAIGSPVATGSSPSAIAIDSSGKFVYVTNFSGSPDISIFSIDSSGKLVSAGSASSGVSPANAASIAFL
jgi:6-phosphogluconolactonase (cycloisomerase 2 family)